LSEFDVKVAGSVTDIAHAHGDPSTLIKDGKATGGTFSVAPGQIVYLGHFGVDCSGEPMLWRNDLGGTIFQARALMFSVYASIRTKPLVARTLWLPRNSIFAGLLAPELPN